MTDLTQPLDTGEWWTYHSAVLELALWLEDRGEIKTAADAIGVFEKPWKWDREFDRFITEKVAAA